jgi:hypothetical protein
MAVTTVPVQMVLSEKTSSKASLLSKSTVLMKMSATFLTSVTIMQIAKTPMVLTRVNVRLVSMVMGTSYCPLVNKQQDV